LLGDLGEPLLAKRHQDKAEPSRFLVRFDKVHFPEPGKFTEQESRMADLGLRPLSLGEILDRTFSLYRKNFLLFAGITAIPQLLVLGLRLVQTLTVTAPRLGATGRLPSNLPSTFGTLIIFGLIGLVVYIVAYLFAQGGTVFAVSELYLGRTTTIAASLGRMRGQLGALFGVVVLNGLAVIAGMICLLIPGIYVACRLITCVPAALLEDLGPVDSLERSFSLTRGFAGRSFLIYLLYFVLLYGAVFLFAVPFSVAVVFAAKHPDVMPMWLALTHIGEFIAGVLVGPILTIATAVFYYDLRVRKEAFDLQFMLNPNDPLAPQGPSIVPRSLY
jgi:hypothetical protein